MRGDVGLFHLVFDSQNYEPAVGSSIIFSAPSGGGSSPKLNGNKPFKEAIISLEQESVNMVDSVLLIGNLSNFDFTNNDPLKLLKQKPFPAENAIKVNRNSRPTFIVNNQFYLCLAVMSKM
jgi:hypothetical protein